MKRPPSEPHPVAPRGLNEWLTPKRFAGILGLLIVTCFPQVVFGIETFYYRDFATFGYPLAAFQRESFWRGELPFWNPYSNCGLPFLAQWNTMPLYPLSLIYLLFPLKWSLANFCLLHMFLAGMGMYYLARKLTNSSMAGGIAGVIFAFNGVTWHSLMWPNYIAALAWMPWVIYSMESACREGGRKIIIATLAGAMQMLAGAPEAILLTWCLAGILILVEITSERDQSLRLLRRFIVVPPLVAGLAAAQLLPFLDLISRSQRDNSFGDAQWSMPASGWANYLVPLFHAYPSPQGVYVQYGQYCFSSYYMGIGGIALAILSLISWRRRRIWVLWAVCIIAWQLSMGDNGFLFPLLKLGFPQIGYMRFPVKFVMVTTFVVPLLAAQGIKNVLERTKEMGKPALKWHVLAGFGAALAALIAAIAWYEWAHPGENDTPGVTLGSAALRVVFLAAILTCVAAVTRQGKPMRHRVALVGLMAFLWFDVFTLGSNLSPTIQPWVYAPDSIRHFLHWEGKVRPGESRAMEGLAGMNKMQFGGLKDPVADYNGRRISLFGNYNLLDHIPKVDGFFALYPREANDIALLVYTSTNHLAPLKDFLGVVEITHPANALDWLERETWIPLFTIGQEPVFMERDEALQHIASDAFQPRRRVILPREAEQFAQAKSCPGATIQNVDFSANRIVLQAEAPGRAMLVIAQTYYHCWRAFVDDQPVRLWRANHAYQAIDMPAGKHIVKLVYIDDAFRAGALVSTAAAMLCALAWRRLNPRRGG